MAAVILSNAHICMGKMNTVYLLIIIIVTFSTLFSCWHIFVLLCVVLFVYQSIILYLCLSLLRFSDNGFGLGAYFLFMDIDQCFTYLLTSSLCNYTIIIPTENYFIAHFVMCTVNVNCGSSVNSNLREYCIVLFYKWNASLPVYYLHLTWRTSSPSYWHAEGGAKYSGDVTAQARIPFDEDS